MAQKTTLGPRTKMLKFVNVLLRITGQNIFYDDWYSQVISFVLTICLGFMMVLGTIEPLTGDFNMEKAAKFFELFGPYYQCLTKVVVHRYYMKTIRRLLQEMDDIFWPPSKFGAESEIRKNKIFNKLYYCSVILVFGMLCCTTMLSVFALTRTKRETLFSCYKLYDYETHTAYWLTIYGIQTFNAIYGCILVAAYDAVFLDFVARLLWELRLLSEGLEALNIEDIRSKEEEEEEYEKIMEFAKHHNILLRMFNDLKKVYSIILLNQFMASTATLCIGLYNISTGKGTSVLAIRGLTFTGTFLFQLSIYCFAGSEIEYQCSKLADYAFYSGWYGPSGKRIKNAIQMIILRARRTPKLTAGDITDANLATFGKILQFSISFYTLLMSKDKRGGMHR